jgi:hypothetical protein
MHNHVGLKLVVCPPAASTDDKVVVPAFNPFYFGAQANINPQSPRPFHQLLDKIRVEPFERTLGAMQNCDLRLGATGDMGELE